MKQKILLKNIFELELYYFILIDKLQLKCNFEMLNIYIIVFIY